MNACGRSMWWLGSLVLLVCAFPGLARAQGSHFLIEPQSGVVWSEGAGGNTAWGVDAGALLAIGGKLRGFPPRFYAFVKGTHTVAALEDRSRSASLGEIAFAHSYVKTVGGARVVIPLFSCLRLNLEMGFGELFSTQTYRETGLRAVSYSVDRDVMEMGLGLSLRIHPLWSFGVMAEHLVSLDGAPFGGQASGMPGQRLALSSMRGTVGFHF